MSSETDPVPQCLDCGVYLLPQTVPAEELPPGFAHRGGRGLCRPDYARRRRQGIDMPRKSKTRQMISKLKSWPRPCGACNIPLVPFSWEREEGQRVHGGRGLCYPCRRREIRAEKGEELPPARPRNARLQYILDLDTEPQPEDDANLTWLRNYLRDRRARGIPAKGRPHPRPRGDREKTPSTP